MWCMRLGQIAQRIAGIDLGPELAARRVVGISTDSRQIRPGELFWALAGLRTDGHRFVAHALAAGAAGAVVRQDYRGQGALLRVADTGQALHQLAVEHRKACRATVIAVTGSVGKSSAREAIWAVLSQTMRGHRSPRNFNNHIGVPLSLLALEPEHEFAVIELGANHPGEIAQLASMARPQIGVLTAIGEAHLEGFGSLQRVTAAKAELIDCLPRSGTAVLNADDPRVRRVGAQAHCQVLWYGTRRHTGRQEIVGFAIQLDRATVSFSIGHGTRVRLEAAGHHQVYAALAAVALGRLFGIDDWAIAQGLSHYRPPPMRCEVHQIGKLTVINDAYNSNPMSMQAALRLLCDWPASGRRVLVFGDMQELGADAWRLHRRLGRQIASCGKIDRCLGVGPLSRVAVEAARQAGMPERNLEFCSSANEAGWWLSGCLAPGDVALVKASRSIGLDKTVAVLQANLESKPGDSQGMQG